MRKFLAAIFAVVVLTLIFLVVGFLGLGYYLSPQDKLQKSDAIVAISGGETDSRALEAIKLYKAGWAPKIIFSGDALDPDSPSNAATMKMLATGEGVPEADILLEEQSTNTLENANSVASIVRDNQIKHLILVTSPYHQRRASVAFRAATLGEVNVLNHSTTDHRWRRSRWWASKYSFDLTMTELQKVLFYQANGTGQNKN